MANMDAAMRRRKLERQTLRSLNGLRPRFAVLALLSLLYAAIAGMPVITPGGAGSTVPAVLMMGSSLAMALCSLLAARCSPPSSSTASRSSGWGLGMSVFALHTVLTVAVLPVLLLLWAFWTYTVMILLAFVFAFPRALRHRRLCRSLAPAWRKPDEQSLRCPAGSPGTTAA